MFDDREADESTVLNFYCSPDGDAWRIYLRPGWLPRYLHNCVDEQGEVYPVFLDFEDLDRQMTRHGAGYTKRVSPAGGVELNARGAAANALALWLSNVFGTAIRPRHGAGAKQVRTV